MRGILALFIRSLRENIRGASFAWMRAGMATVVLLTLLFFKGMDTIGAAGMEFFQPFAVYNAAMIAIAAMSYFASAITEEKEEQTLGLLRMTDLSVLAILFGKSTSRIVSGLMLLAVQVPFALLAITLGGMTWEQIAITYALLCGFLFFTANLGLLASVLAPTGGKAGVLTGIIGFFYLFPQPLFSFIGWLCRLFHKDGDYSITLIINEWEEYTGPGAFFSTIEIGGASQHWKETILYFGIAGAVCFLLAWALFSRFAHDEANLARRKETRGRLGWLKPRAGRTWADAIAWKDFHFILGGGQVFWVKTLLYLVLVIWVGWETFRNSNGSVWGWCADVFAWGIQFLYLEIVFSASRLYRLEQRWQTLGSLYILPQDIPAMQRAKRSALLRSLVPVGSITVLSALFGLPYVLDDGFRSVESFFVFIQFILIIPFEIVFHYRLVAWLSMRLKWGGLPAALVISFFGHLFISPFLVIGVKEAAGIPLIMILSGANVGLKRAIRRNIEASATVG